MKATKKKSWQEYWFDVKPRQPKAAKPTPRIVPAASIQPSRQPQPVPQSVRIHMTILDYVGEGIKLAIAMLILAVLWSAFCGLILTIIFLFSI